MVDIAERLATLTTRPPTPPKENLEKLEKLIGTSSEPNWDIANITSRILLDTPNESPPSSAESFAGSLEKGTKKVGFSPWLKYHKSVSVGGQGLASDGDLRRLPPSRHCKSSTSILKPSTNIVTSSPMGGIISLDGSNFPEMIQSILALLRTSSRISRLDAYSALLGSLSAYDDLPEGNALAENLQEFTGCIRRDVCCKHGEKGTLDTQLATQSLKLLTIFLCTPTIADLLPDDFRKYILDKSISSLENAELPKIVVNHYMQILAKQNFSEKHMTIERANRILLVMRDLVDRVKGNSIIGLRFRIYGRLLVQARQTLASNATEWIDHLVSGMLSTTKEIRSLAIAFGIDAGIALGTTSSVSQACFELFNRKSTEGRTVVDFLTKRLNEMTNSKDDTLHVPQIWSVLILHLRNRRHQLERWVHLRAWLVVIQKCLNSSDPSVKSLAMTAWNRLVLAVNLDSSTSPQMIKMLRQPIVTHLNRKGRDKLSKQTRQLAHSSYCNLLYYSFRPSATHDQLDVYWEQYVDQILPDSFLASKRDINQACAILTALFHASQPKPWDEHRANTPKFIKPDELPCLDPKWTRSRATKIVGVFGKLIEHADWSRPEEGEAGIVLAWQSFTLALNDASKQEVKVSVHTMSAVAQILNMLAQFWDRAYVQRHGLTPAEFSITLRKICLMIEAAIGNIGAITFNERRLLWTSSKRFEAAETPSSRSNRYQGTLSSPIFHLLRLLVSTIRDTEAAETYANILQYLLDLNLHSSSRASQLAMLRDLTGLVTSDTVETNHAMIQLWQLIAKATMEVIKKPRSDDRAAENSQHAGREFRDATKILEIGVYQQFPDLFGIWESLQSAICESLRQEVGNGGITILLTEPLSVFINQKMADRVSNFSLSCAGSLVRTATLPTSAQDIERARRLLWGNLIANHKSVAPDPSEQLYAMVDRALSMAYASCEQLDKRPICALLEALTNGLCSCPRQTKTEILKRVQQGIALWIEDSNGLLPAPVLDHAIGRICSAVRNLWAAIEPVIEQMPHNNTSLKSFQVLMTSSLGSRHRVIVNDAIGLWNRTFGTANQLEYPDTLRVNLARLRSMTDIQLPTFPEMDDAVVTAPFQFIESQVSSGGQTRPLTPEPLKARKSPKIGRKSSKSHRGARKSSLVATSPTTKLSQSKQRVSKTPQKVRLRHDDSQVQFAAIDSSSPLVPEEMIMTDHQLEIRERQGRETAMFSELGSSPKLPSGRVDRDLPRLELSGSKNHHQADVDPDAQVSPMFPIIDGAMESFLGSSPTPRSGDRDTASWSLTTGRASSPPPPNISVERGEEAGVTDLADVKKAVEKKDPEVETLHQNQVINTQGNVIPSDTAHEPISSSRPPSDAGRTTPVATSVVPPAVSSAEILTDALAQMPSRKGPSKDEVVKEEADPPPLQTPGRVRQDDGNLPTEGFSGLQERPASTDVDAADDATITCVTDSFQSQSSFYSNDDEQISAQLAVDMERASSQAGSAKSNKKRKRSVREPARGNKRARGVPQAQSCHVLIDAQRPYDFDEDCVIVDTRTAIGSPGQQCPPIKRERSPSPNTTRLFPQYHDTGKDASIPSKEIARNSEPGPATFPDCQAEELQASRQKSKQSESAQVTSSQRSSTRRSARLSGATGIPPSSDGERNSPSHGQGGRGAEEASAGSGSSSQLAGTLQTKMTSPIILEGFKKLLQEVKGVSLGAEEERAMVTTLFECVTEVHEAGRRHWS